MLAKDKNLSVKAAFRVTNCLLASYGRLRFATQKKIKNM